jgi:hypothetical protein
VLGFRAQEPDGHFVSLVQAAALKQCGEVSDISEQKKAAILRHVFLDSFLGWGQCDARYG